MKSAFGDTNQRLCAIPLISRNANTVQYKAFLCTHMHTRYDFSIECNTQYVCVCEVALNIIIRRRRLRAAGLGRFSVHPFATNTCGAKYIRTRMEMCTARHAHDKGEKSRHIGTVRTVPLRYYFYYCIELLFVEGHVDSVESAFFPVQVCIRRIFGSRQKCERQSRAAPAKRTCSRANRERCATLFGISGGSEIYTCPIRCSFTTMVD